MKKLLSLALVGCGEVNNAEVIAKGQNPDLTCETAITKANHVHIAVCYLTDKDKKTTHTFITATSKYYPFQAFQLKSVEQVKAEAQQAPTPPAATGSAAPVEEKK